MKQWSQLGTLHHSSLHPVTSMRRWLWSVTVNVKRWKKQLGSKLLANVGQPSAKYESLLLLPKQLLLGEKLTFHRLFGRSCILLSLAMRQPGTAKQKSKSALQIVLPNIEILSAHKLGPNRREMDFPPATLSEFVASGISVSLKEVNNPLLHVPYIRL